MLWVDSPLFDQVLEDAGARQGIILLDPFVVIVDQFTPVRQRYLPALHGDAWLLGLRGVVVAGLERVVLDLTSLRSLCSRSDIREARVQRRLRCCQIIQVKLLLHHLRISIVGPKERIL